MKTLIGGKVLGRGLWLTVILAATSVRACAIGATLLADAHVNAALPAVNSGAISNVNVGNGFTGLMQFDLGVLPSGTTSAQIARAILRVYVNRVDTAGLVSVQPLTSAWSEYGVTFQTLPAMSSATQTFTVSQEGAYVAVDVTSLVQGWVNAPASNFGLALTAATAVAQFDSKENDLTGHAATLDLELVSQGPAGAQGATGAQGAAGPAGPAGATGPAGPVGPVGTTGATGSAGAAGAKGATGATGPAGVAGVAGAQGAQGLPGLGFEGAYASTTNYGLNDTVYFQGSSYISMIASNHGNTPGYSPGQWTVIASIGAQGAAGPAGPQGTAGAAGIQGPKGDAGVGTPGLNGAPGLPGLVYQGVYASANNYALGDVVLWQGSSWSSLVAGNHGNTPSFSPAYWGVLTAQGATGATGATGASGPQGLVGALGPVGPPGEKGDQGAQGIAGQAGAQGLTGAKGDMGLSGPMGPQGVAGPVGLTFQGIYQSASNYALADGVVYNGTGYVSLVGSNHGNTPDQSPTAWAIYAKAGTPGALGAVGPQGAIGLTGPQGQQGFTGATGMPGPQGLQGAPVANYLGNYASTSNYAFSDAVSYGGSTYISLVAGNHGNTPDLSPSYFAVLAARGATGAAGTAGLQGAPGPAGASGAAGTPGAAGPPVTFLGGWLTGTGYSPGDAVSYGGGSYIALTPNTGREPDISPIYWGSLAQAGSAGVAGPQGATGFQGPTGYPGPQGAIGPAGTTGPTGPAGAAGAVGPSGLQGIAGPAGPGGPSGLNYRGTYSSSTSYALNDAVIFQGSSYLSSIASNAGNTPTFSPAFWSPLALAGAAGANGATGATGASGVAGPSGPAGQAGAAASVQIGTVATGAAGSSASVVNVGTSSAAVLNFTIPQGSAVSSGATPPGGGSTSGVLFASMYHSVNYANTFLSVNNTNQGSTESGTVLTWVPLGCSATQLVAYSLQAATITVTLRVGTPGSMSNTALSCQVSQGQSCTGATIVTIPAGAFIDLGIAHADSTQQGVWTALNCN